MYRYGEDFVEEGDVSALLAQFLQKKKEERNTDTVIITDANETVKKKNENLDYLLDR